MSISVALCTHNGARFLEEQLSSIAAQERLPDELVICDDCSTDNTAAIVERFAATAPFPVRFSVNPSRLGSTKNFEQAIARCQRDIIALADQDDVWMPHKLARLEFAFAETPEAGFAFSDATMVAEDLAPLGYSLWEAIRFSPRERRRMAGPRRYEVLLKHYVVTGATLAFRARHRPLVLPIPAPWIHDAWIALLISTVAPAVPIPEPLIQYRQHAGQQLGERKRNLYQQFLVARTMTQESYRRETEAYALAAERLATAAKSDLTGDVGVALQCKVSHFRARTRMRDAGVWRLPLIVREVLGGGYCRYSLGWKSMAQDLLL